MQQKQLLNKQKTFKIQKVNIKKKKIIRVGEDEEKFNNNNHVLLHLIAHVHVNMNLS